MVERSHTSGNTQEGFWPHVLDPLRQFGHKVADFFAPAADASAGAEHYDIAVELPGVKESDLNLEVHGNVLQITGEKRSRHTEEGRTWYFAECRVGTFQRSFRLPEDADASAISADFKDGVLSISIPKRSAETKNARKIPISTS